MARVLPQIGIALAFLLVNVIILLIILKNQQSGPGSNKQGTSARESPGQDCLDPSDILGWEFEYARVTASEAMQDRHTMINFYLLVAGVVASGVVAVLGQSDGLPEAAGTLLLWLLCGIGWFYFLKIICLRQHWHDSARTMNQIKEFYIQHAEGFDPDLLRSAFRWQAHTLPAPGKPWTVFFYSATLIGFLDSAAYVAGGALLHFSATRPFPLFVLGPLVVFGLAFFAFHVWLYFAFLK